ncbi:hypothetical protein SCHPADRAFT_578088 [Schizopora paradoxa]|uniref:MYND-type domain-containing protein n=1 Tax=Schizopora paradoxa TaxID=27342 RepID=A0A0H2RI76_9AGAM|nr:hypothetical protein SCHPADRAFT_578088 [Schizopora paradoxa]
MPLHAGEPPNMPHEQDNRAGFGVALRVTSPSGKGPGIRSKHYRRRLDDSQLKSTRSEAPLVVSRGELDSLTTHFEEPSSASGREERPRNGPYIDGPPGLTISTCKVCGAATVNLCKGCRVVSYCSSEHQKQDWPKHAQECRDWAQHLVIPASNVGSECISSRTVSLEPENEMALEFNDDQIDAFTPGVIFEVDAILIAVNKPLPEIVKAAFEVVYDHVKEKLIHRERCFSKFLGAAASWLPDAQWDEDVHQLSSVYPLSDECKNESRLSLHCRPNGNPNFCYATLVGLDALRPSAINPTPIWGAISAINPYDRGNGNFLVLRHPPGICCPEVPGALVENATLADLEKVIPFLEQRRHYMSTTGGVRSKISICPH